MLIPIMLSREPPVARSGASGRSWMRELRRCFAPAAPAERCSVLALPPISVVLGSGLRGKAPSLTTPGWPTPPGDSAVAACDAVQPKLVFQLLENVAGIAGARYS